MKRWYSGAEVTWLMMMTAVMWLVIMLLSPGAYDGRFWRSAVIAALFSAGWAWLAVAIIGRRKGRK